MCNGISIIFIFCFANIVEGSEDQTMDTTMTDTTMTDTTMTDTTMTDTTMTDTTMTDTTMTDTTMRSIMENEIDKMIELQTSQMKY